MTIALGLFLELISVASSYFININSGAEAVLELTKNGYKIDYDTYEKYIEKVSKEFNKNKYFKILLLLLPGINIINAFINKNKYKKDMVNDRLIRESKVPMTDKEIEQFNNIKYKYNQLLYTLFLFTNTNEEKELIFDGIQPIIIDNCLLKLEEKLLPLAYTLEEVMYLNNLTNNSYRLGKVDGVNTAIIGIPNSQYKVLRVNYDFENELETHDFNEISLEEAKDKTFIVYLFNPNPVIKEKVDNGIIDIQNKRDSKRKVVSRIDNLSLTNNYVLKRIRKK